jgi:GTP-binding protein HflX
VRSAGSQILTVITGKRMEPQAKYFVGQGKAEEIQHAVKALKADLIIFNHELTPAQERNLEKLTECRVLSRTGLILDIFAQRARTFEGKLQVELAQLQHISTRLVRGWTHLERQRGGIGLRGPGETQLETDRRLVGARIKSIKKRLAKVVTQREQGRRARERAEIPTVSIIGYTNAGKSTLFNRLTDATVYTANKLFATLDPTLRQIELPPLGKIILADTVGFIRDLPHDLVAAFRATLEETRQADLLLHVVDAHAEHIEAMMGDVEKVLTEIDADQVLQLQIYNKIDLVPNMTPRIDRNDSGQPQRVLVSALTGDGITLIHQAIVELLADKLIECDIILNPDQGQLLAKLHRLKVIKSEAVDDEGHIHLVVEMQRKDYNRLFPAPRS